MNPGKSGIIYRLQNNVGIRFTHPNLIQANSLKSGAGTGAKMLFGKGDLFFDGHIPVGQRFD